MKVIAVLVMSVGVMGCAPKLDPPLSVANEVRANGARAFKLGISDEANPYQGRSWADDWLNGYMDAKENAAQ